MRQENTPHPFGYLAWSGAIALSLILAITVIAVLVQKPDILYMESGPLENMSITLWLLSAFAAAAAYRRWTGKIDRLVAFWVALISCLATLREADAHILLNPAVIGSLGIHYRIDWLLDPRASLLLKLGYATLFTVLVGAIFGPLFVLRSRFWRLTRAGDAGIGMLIVAAVGILLGYVMDDLLRNSPLMTKAIRQLTEESGEFLGAIAFLSGSLLLLKLPVSQRLIRKGP